MTVLPLEDFDPILADRLQRLAQSRGWTQQEAMTQALERGLMALEAEGASQLAFDEAEVLRQAIAALEQIPSSTYAAIGKPATGKEEL